MNSSFCYTKEKKYYDRNTRQSANLDDTSGNGERRNKISTTNEHIRERDDDDYDDDRIYDYDDRRDKRVVLGENSKILIRKKRGESRKCHKKRSAICVCAERKSKPMQLLCTFVNLHFFYRIISF